MERCKHGFVVAQCGYCCGRPRFVVPNKTNPLNKRASPAPSFWDLQDVKLLLSVRYASDEVRIATFHEIATRTKRTYQVVWKKFMIVTGEAYRRGWDNGSGGIISQGGFDG